MTSESVSGSVKAACPDCLSDLAPFALTCDRCGALVHRSELSDLAMRARVQAEQGQIAAERQLLEQMLTLLPASAPQASKIRSRLDQLGSSQAAGGTPITKSRALTLLGVLGLGIWKFKAFLVLLLTKGKFLLLGLTKAKTAFSMLIALGAYWTVWGWQFALGFVLSIYIHEMGHVIALRRLGIPASAPMFIPFVGAFVRLHRGPQTPHDDAVVGLAGPLYGLGAAFVCYLLYLATGVSLLGALARSGAWINLFNLIPIWQLDGGRAFNALNRRQRWVITASIGVAWLLSQESMLLLLLIGAVFRAFNRNPPTHADRQAAWTYGILLVSLSVLSAVSLPELTTSAPELVP